MSETQDSSSTMKFPPGNSSMTSAPRVSESSQAVDFAHNHDHMDPLTGNKIPLSEAVKKLEDDNVMYRDEYYKIRHYVRAMRSILGMPEQPGRAIRLSSALQEIVTELDQRADVFGNIDPEISI